MSILLRLKAPAVLLVSAFWASAASAYSIPYHPESKVVKGVLDYPSLPERTFVSDEHHDKTARFQDEDRDHNHRDEHANRGHRRHVHNGRDDDSEGNTPPTLPGESNYPPVPSTSAVPVPAALWLFVSGIIGLGMAGRRRR